MTTTNSTHKPKDRELEIKNKSPVFKLRSFNLHLCLSLFRDDSMIRLKLHIRKEGTLLQNMQHCSCNLVGMSCPRKIRCFHKRFCNKDIEQLRDVKNPRTNSYVSMMEMTDCLLILPNFVQI